MSRESAAWGIGLVLGAVGGAVMGWPFVFGAIGAVVLVAVWEVLGP